MPAAGTQRVGIGQDRAPTLGSAVVRLPAAGGLRPHVLTPLFASVTALDGVGPRVLTLLHKLLDRPAEREPRVLDLLCHLPTGVIDRTARPQIADAVPGTLVTLEVRVLAHPQARPKNAKAPYKIVCGDASGEIDLVFFRAEAGYLRRLLPEGEPRFISGRVERYGERLQMLHPDHMLDAAEFATMPLLEPVYPLTAGLAGRSMVKFTTQALAKVPALPDWLDPSMAAETRWPDFGSALRAIHRPGKPEDLSTTASARQRLAYDELLAHQLALALVREHMRRQPGRTLAPTGAICARITEALPFSLTNGQKTALGDIGRDLTTPTRMLRLLQGDVGSGKTIVALMSLAMAVEAGCQGALMAPTELLARQHLETLLPLCDAAGLRIALLTGREKGRPRRALLERLMAGDIDIVVGTHALFQDDVAFRDLGLVVIDEQHRFGVHQRLALQNKGGPLGTKILVMTATPIPRTLLLAHYGDMDVSRLTEKPAGRKPIATRAVAIDRLEEILAGLARALEEGAQIYWVCPLVESNADSPLFAAEERFAHLRQRFGDRVGLVHGKMPGVQKDAQMSAFAAGSTRILVATTVIEVGVNVPNASIMVIEHAERFGLAQLHQLRGRVGRGNRQSSCILLYHNPLGEIAKQRLTIMRETEDGFGIAEEDLRLRGGGELLGTRQSGDAEFRLADVPGLSDLLATAKKDATLILHRDPELKSARGQALRTLLYLFERDEAVRLFRAG